MSDIIITMIMENFDKRYSIYQFLIGYRKKGTEKVIYIRIKSTSNPDPKDH